MLREYVFPRLVVPLNGNQSLESTRGCIGTLRLATQHLGHGIQQLRVRRPIAIKDTTGVIAGNALASHKVIGHILSGVRSSLGDLCHDQNQGIVEHGSAPTDARLRSRRQKTKQGGQLLIQPFFLLRMDRAAVMRSLVTLHGPLIVPPIEPIVIHLDRTGMP